MNLPNLTGEEREKILNNMEKIIREEETTKLALNADEAPLSAIIKIRKELNMGWNLENSCPYIRGCDKEHSVNCIDKKNYREQPCYKIRIVSDTYAKKFDSLEIFK